MMVVPVPPGKGMIFTDGGETLPILGKRPAVIESIAMNGGTSTLDFLGARLVLPARKLDLSNSPAGFLRSRSRHG